MAGKKEVQTKPAEERSTPAPPPVAKYAAGLVQLAVWANRGPNDRVFYSVKVERSYRPAGGEGKSTSSLRVNDIPRAILVLQKAYERIVLNRLEDPDATGEDAVGTGGARTPTSRQAATDGDSDGDDDNDLDEVLANVPADAYR